MNYKLMKTSKSILFAFTLLIFTTSCEKELYDEAIKNQEFKGNPKPNIQVNSLKFSKNHPTIQKISQKTKSNFKSSRSINNIEHNTIEAFFGEVNLDNGIEIIDSLNRKTTTFEVKETIEKPNEYYNFVIQNDTELWLYKIEKIDSQSKNIPANSTVVSRYALNENLSMSNPCDSIVFPPFGYYQPEEIIPSNGGGGISIGNINNPGDGGSYGGFFWRIL